MFSIPAANLSGLRLTRSLAKSEPNSRPPDFDNHSPAIPEAGSESQPRKFKASPQLKRWSMARAIRSGRKLDRPGNRSNNVTDAVRRVQGQGSLERSRSEINGDLVAEPTLAKSIYMVSDGTGWTVEQSVNAALGQFDHCLVDRECPVNTHLFSGIENEGQLIEVVKQAAKEDAMLVYTLADPSMANSAKQACKLWGVPSTDMLGPITEAIASHLGVSPSGLPRGARSRLSEDYFRMIEAIEFTIKQDDGALPENLEKADIVLVGVSRTGKTPLSTYLAQKGYKVANVPIVMGLKLPRSLFKVNPINVFGLTINPVVLQAIRKTRAKSLGLHAESSTRYSEMDYVREELEVARKIFAENPSWPVIEVTGKAIEETAAVILRLYHDRRQRCSMPRISKRY